MGSARPLRRSALYRRGSAPAASVRGAPPQRAPREPKGTIIFRIVISRISLFIPLFFFHRIKNQIDALLANLCINSLDNKKLYSATIKQ